MAWSFLVQCACWHWLHALTAFKLTAAIVTKVPDMWQADFLARTAALLAHLVALAAAAVGPLKLHHSSQLHSPAIGVQFAALGALVLHPVW